MGETSRDGCAATFVVFGILAYFGHPTWWLKGSHDGLGLIIILPAYYLVLGLLSIAATTLLGQASERIDWQRQVDSRSAETSAPKIQSVLRVALVAYFTFGMVALWADFQQIQLLSGSAKVPFILVDVLQLIFFVALLVFSEKLPTLLPQRPYLIPAILATSILVSIVHFVSWPDLTQTSEIAVTKGEELTAFVVGIIVRFFLLGLAVLAGHLSVRERNPD